MGLLKNHTLTLFKERLIAFFFIFVFTFITYAQNPNQLVYEGNQSFMKNNMQTAINKYNEALKIQPNHKKAYYNLANAYYKAALTLKYSNNTLSNIPNKDSIVSLMLQKSSELYSAASQLYKHKDSLQKTYHNTGNSYLFQRKYNEAIEAYKKALKINPNDEETRYNLAYALKHKQENKSGNNNQQQQNKNKQQQQPPPQQINKEQAERLLQTLIQKEKELQSKKKEQSAGHPEKTGKDW